MATAEANIKPLIAALQNACLDTMLKIKDLRRQLNDIESGVLMFPVPGDEIEYNEAGEPIGWSKPASPDSYYCDRCGFNHAGECEE